MLKALPFKIVKDDARPLVRQVADGLRGAVVGGYYSPGDRLPSFDAMAKMLGVSRIVTKEAFKRVAAEGLLASRERLGTFVRDTGVKQWRGHVVLLGINNDDNYLQSVLAGTLRGRLMDAGYLFTQVHVSWTRDGKPDFSSLDAELARSVDLVVSLYKVDAKFRYLAKRKVPFAAFAEIDAAPRGSVGFTKLDYNLAVGDFADECDRLGVKEVVEVNWYPTMCDLSLLKKRGIRVRRMKIKVDFFDSNLAAIRRAGMAAFAKLAGQGRISRNAVYFFGDDNLASGALAALSYAGLRAPEDFRFATWANKNNELAYPRELSRMSLDPAGAGAAVADAVLAYLRTDAYPSGTVVGPEWISGETMGGIVRMGQSGAIAGNRRQLEMDAAP